MKNIKMFWYSTIKMENMEKENFGDFLSKYLVEKISRKNVVWVYPIKYKMFFFLRKHYLVIGSILSHASKKSIVWGSGIIEKKEKVAKAKFLAVRGPKTRKRLLELGYNVPEIYGDPAILTPDYYHPKIEKKYKIGVICHYVDFDDISSKINFENVTVINLLTNDIESKIDEILSCETLITSSLHGLILGHAYRIPSLWVKFSEKLYGDDIKFFDYFESIKLDIKEPIYLKKQTITEKDLEALLDQNSNLLLPNKNNIKILKENLMNSCPFKN